MITARVTSFGSFKLTFIFQRTLGFLHSTFAVKNHLWVIDRLQKSLPTPDRSN